MIIPVQAMSRGIAGRLIHILFVMSKGCDIYPATALLASAAWCSEVASTVQEELRCVMSTKLVTYAACIWHELDNEDRSAGEVINQTNNDIHEFTRPVYFMPALLG